MPRRTHSTITIAALSITALLSACSTTSTPQATTSTDTVMTVMQPGTASDAQLEAQYGGHLITRTPTFALLTVGADRARLAPLSTKVKIEKNRKIYRVGKGRGQTSTTVSGSGTTGVWGSGTTGVWGSGTTGVWGSGTTGVWGSGTTGVWGSGTTGVWGAGTTGVWGSGTYEPLPQNSDNWQQVSLAAVQNTGRAGGAGTTVAIIDTGIDLNHSAFSGRLTDPLTWHDFVANDATPQDEGDLGTGLSGHGTEVAGIVAQIAPLAKLMPLRVLSSDGSGDVGNVAAAIVWATDHGANVINLSLGSDASVTAVTQAIAYANSHGVTIAASAGNNGAEGIDFPAAEFSAQPMNISVGSVDIHDAKSMFSQYSTSLELLAPGEMVFGPAPQNRFAAWSGTSMSAPVVAGGLALGLSTGATGAQAAQALTTTAVSVAAVSGNAPYAGKLGAGRIDLDRALTALGH